MKKIGITEIEDGLILAKEVVNDNNQLLLGAGSVIKRDQMEKLLEDLMKYKIKQKHRQGQKHTQIMENKYICRAKTQKL